MDYGMYLLAKLCVLTNMKQEYLLKLQLVLIKNFVMSHYQLKTRYFSHAETSIMKVYKDNQS